MVTPNLATASVKAFPAATTRAWSARLVECVSVKDFNAKGDSSTNDGPALQAALTFLRTTSSPSSRGLYIPAGTYLTSQVLNITNTQGVRIFGDGAESTKIQYTGSATAGNTEAPATGGANAMTPVIMTNGFSYSTLKGVSLVNQAGANTVGIYFFQDATHSKGQTNQLRISDVQVYGNSGSIAVGFLIGYQATALCSEIMFQNCGVTGATLYGFRNISTNALNNNLYNCGGVLNAVWHSCALGKADVYGGSLSQNTLDIQAGQLPILVSGTRTESLNFVDGTASQSYITINGCSQEPFSAASAASFVNLGSATVANLTGNYIGSTAANQGKILGSGFLNLIGNQTVNTTPYSSYTGSIRTYSAGQFSGTVATLPAAAAPFKGVRLFVTDSTAAASTANFSSTVTGGGSNTVPVWCDGTAWRIG